jgi:plasmid maintenance system antidote protein VapI
METEDYQILAEIELVRSLLTPTGDILAEQLDDRGLTQIEFAIAMGRPVSAINEMINGKKEITIETAIQIELVLGIPHVFWLNYERLYQVKLTNLNRAEAALKHLDWLDQFPLKELKQKGLIPTANKSVLTVESIFRLSRTASVEAFNNVYKDAPNNHLFKLTHNRKVSMYPLGIWLGMGDTAAFKLWPSAEYDKKAFESLLKSLATDRLNALSNITDHAVLWPILQVRCLAVGLKLVHVETLTKARVSGAARWHGRWPIIQLSDTSKTIETFWFTFFHEAGHIMLHGKKDKFIDGLPPEALDPIKESAADAFANKLMGR